MRMILSYRFLKFAKNLAIHKSIICNQDQFLLWHLYAGMVIITHSYFWFSDHAYNYFFYTGDCSHLNFKNYDFKLYILGLKLSLENYMLTSM